jgi:hypothetical protein
MTTILVDPQELTTVAATLRNVAAETAEVGRGLSHCTQCAMPPEVESLVNQIVSTSDAILDELARRMAASANDLLSRAGIATNDSLTAASAASGPGLYPSSATIGGTGPGWTMEGTDISALISGAGIVGGSGSIGVVGGAPNLGMSIVGGTNPWSPSSSGSFLTAVIGPPDYSQGPASGIMALAAASQRSQDRVQAGINAIMANPNSSPAMQSFALDLQGQVGDSLSTLTADSRADIERRWGRPVSLAEFHALNTGGFDGFVSNHFDPMAVIRAAQAAAS